MPARRLPIYFAHMHKAGGTTVVDDARWHGETVDENGSGGFAYADTAAQLAHLRRRNISFLALELMPRQLPSGVLMATLLREPTERSVSHFAHTSFKLGLAAPCPAYFAEWVGATLDNMMVRQLCGPACAGVAVGRLDRAHLDAALHRVSAMDVVGTLEDWPGFARQLGQLAGWKRPTPTGVASRVTPGTRGWQRAVSRDAALAANRLDLELYERAAAAARNSSVRRRAPFADAVATAAPAAPAATAHVAYVSPLWCGRLLPQHGLGRCDPAEHFVNRTRTLCPR